MRIDEVIYNIASRLGRQNDLELIERLEKQVDYFRALIFRRSYENQRYISPQFIQSLKCLPTEEVKEQCGDLSVNCVVYRTEQQIPSFVRLRSRSAVNFVGTIDKSVVYPEIDPNSVKYNKFSKYIKKTPGFYIENGYIYIVNAAPVFLRVEGVFEHPSRVSEVLDCKGSPYSYEDYPASLDVIQQITQSVLSMELENVSNNESEERNEQS
jgi:hypothetical protein